MLRRWAEIVACGADDERGRRRCKVRARQEPLFALQAGPCLRRLNRGVPETGSAFVTPFTGIDARVHQSYRIRSCAVRGVRAARGHKMATSGEAYGEHRPASTSLPGLENSLAKVC